MSGRAIDNPGFSANDVNLVNANDRLRGAGVGSPYGGVGELNAGVQVLANRTSLLFNRQETNINNIAVIQSKLVPSSGSLFFELDQTTTINFNTPYTYIRVNFTFPPSSPTGLFILGYQMAALFIGAPTAPTNYLVNVAMHLYDITNLSQELAMVLAGPAITVGPTQASEVNNSGMTPRIYQPGVTAQFTMVIDLTVALYNILVTKGQIRLYAIPAG